MRPVAQSAPLPIDPIAEAKRQWRDHGWADAADGMAAVTSIMRVQQLLLARVENTLKPFELSFARYEVLRLLSFTRDGAMPMNRASALLQLHPTSVTNTVARLEHDGFVARSAHPTDGRATIVTVTEIGRVKVSEATAALNADVFENPGMASTDLNDLVKILARFRQSAGDFTPPPTFPDPL